VDATHPYAVQASETIRGACRGEGVPLLRLLRAACPVPEGAAVFASPAEAADWLRGTEGNILLTTGAKELGAFASLGGERLYPRVLPLADSLSACGAAGVPASHVIAMQGPFSRELNEALIRQYRIAYLVTKDGGRAGGFEEKAAAAEARVAEKAKADHLKPEFFVQYQGSDVDLGALAESAKADVSIQNSV